MSRAFKLFRHGFLLSRVRDGLGERFQQRSVDCESAKSRYVFALFEVRLFDSGSVEDQLPLRKSGGGRRTLSGRPRELVPLCE
jgi:hypothetical protein